MYLYFKYKTCKELLNNYLFVYFGVFVTKSVPMVVAVHLK